MLLSVLIARFAPRIDLGKRLRCVREKRLINLRRRGSGEARELGKTARGSTKHARVAGSKGNGRKSDGAQREGPEAGLERSRAFMRRETREE